VELLRRVPRDTRLPTLVVDGVMRALVGPAAAAPRPARTEAAVMALVTGNAAMLPRPEQSAVLEDAAAGRDTVVGFSTGAGKSLCFLYGGLLRRAGLTLVIGPLVATNAELVAKLNRRAREHEGDIAGPIADALGGAAVADPADALRLALRGDLEVLVCTPESFLRASAALGWAHRQRPFALVAIDEAATVTTWEFRSSHGALAPQLREWLPEVPRMALSASLTPEMLAGAVLSDCDLTAPRLHLHHEPRRNLAAYVVVGGTAAQLHAALGLKGPALPPSAEADAAFGAFLEATRWGRGASSSAIGGGGGGGGGGEGDDGGDDGGGGGDGEIDGDGGDGDGDGDGGDGGGGDNDGGGGDDIGGEPGGEAATEVAADAAAEQEAEEAASTATTEVELRAALAMARPAASSDDPPPPPSGAAAATTAAAARAGKIAYVPTRKAAETLAAYLATCGVRAGVYHAGSRERACVAARWHAGELEAVCATIAFGLGVDHPNVTHVVTWGYEPELDQQWGRAGRGGQPARCTLVVPSLALPRLDARGMSTSMERLARWRLGWVHAAATFGAGGGDAWLPLLGGLYGRRHAPAPAQLPSPFDEEPVPFSEYLDEEGAVRAVLGALAVASAAVPAGEAAQAAGEALTLVGPYARPDAEDGSPHWADWRRVHRLRPPPPDDGPDGGAPVEVPAIAFRAALPRLLQLHGRDAAVAFDELQLRLGLHGLLKRNPQPQYDAATAAAELRERRSRLRSAGDEGAAARAAAAAPPPLLFAGLTPHGWAVLRGAAAPPAGLLAAIRDTAEGRRAAVSGTMPRLRAALEGADRRWLLETVLSVLALEDERRPLPPPDADLEAATRLEPERLAPGGAMARVWKGTLAERERIAHATARYEANLARAPAGHVVSRTPVTREPQRTAADVAAQVAEQMRMQAALMRARGAYAWRGVVALVRQGRTMTASAADFLACLALVHRLLGVRSPFGGAAPGGLDAALAEGLDVVRGHVRLVEVPLAKVLPAEPLMATARVTTEPKTNAISIERVFNYGSAEQKSAAGVPGAAANCLVLWQRGTPRPELQDDALFANLMFAAAASDGCPRLFETEGYQQYDQSTGHEHATQTARIGSGRVVPVRQRHGLLSLTLVARKGGEPDPSFEATVLHRGF